MINKEFREPLERCFCCCVSESADMRDDGKPVEHPTRIGISILFYGKRKSSFPFHCMVGPDWPFVVGVYMMIVGINAGVLYAIHPIGWPLVLIGAVGAIALLWAYSMTVFSDPGIVYKNDYPSPDDRIDVERGSNLTTPIMKNSSSIMPAVPHTIECGQCELRRPYTARHCDYCKLCIDNLDHHCPWWVLHTILSYYF